jgi:putative peptidoglycan lipid II flippase
MLPHSVVTVSIATAYFTRMAEHNQAGREKEFKVDLTTGLRVIALVSVISSAVLIVLSYPVARVFVGEYPATAALGNVIAAFMIGLLPFSFVYMMQRAFFALEDTRTPFIFTSIQIAIHITGSITAGFLAPKEILVVTIALVTAFSISMQGIIAYTMLKKRIGTLSGFGVSRSLARFVLSAVPATAAGIGALWLIGGVGADSFAVDSVLSAVLSCMLVSTAMASVYLLTLGLLKSPELGEIFAGLKGRFGQAKK